MNEEQQLKLQAFLDGELPENEAREMAAWLARDAEAAGLLTELRNTRQALGGFEQDVKLPETREFYWSKIEREIRRSEPAAEVVPRSSISTLLRRLLFPAAAVAALVIAGIIAGRQFGTTSPAAETALADTGAFTYRDQAQGMTVVWLSYPAEK